MDWARRFVLGPSIAAFVAAFVAAFIAVSVTACSEAPQGETDTQASQPQTLHRGNGPEPESLDPQKSRSDSSATILRDLFEGLVSEAPDGSLVPGAARDWELSEDGTTYTFHLREDARWSDGSPVTAGDFVRGWRRCVDPATASTYAQMLMPLVNAPEAIAGELPPTALGVEAVDARTLKVELRAPTPYFLALLTHPSSFPVHGPSIAEHGEDFARAGRLVSNGAYRLSDWVMHERVVAERNPHYWDDAGTAIDRVVYHHIEDESSELKRFRAGELHITYTIPVKQYGWIRDELGEALRITPYLSTYFYGFNLTREPFENAPELRRALSLVVDRELITEKITGVGEVPAYGWIPPGILGYTPQRLDYAERPMDERIEEARRLYREAGYGPDQPLRTEIRYNTGENHRRVAVAVASMWKEHLGVETELVNEEWKALIQHRQDREVTQVFRSGWVGDYNDPYTFAEVLQSEHGINDMGYYNPAYDALLEQATLTTEEAERRRLLEAAERMMLEDHPILPLYFYVSKHLVDPAVRGWEDNIMDHHYSKDLILETGPDGGG